MVEEVASKVLEAYKTSPLLTGLLLLNIGLIVGFGWFTIKKNEMYEALVIRTINEEKEFRDELLRVATSCDSDPQATSGKAGYGKLNR